MICPHCQQETETTQESERVTNWLPVWIGGVEYTAVKWGSIEQRCYYDNGMTYYAPTIPLLFVERFTP